MPEEHLRLEQENRRLRRAVEELAVLNEIASATSSTLSLGQIVEVIVERCVRHLGVEQTAVMLLSAETGRPFQTMVRKVDSAAEVLPYRFGDQLAGWMLKNRTPLLINDPEGDDRLSVSDAVHIRTLLSVPMVLKGRLIGLLNVFNKRDPAGFTSEDQRLLAIIASQSAQIIENARLYQTLEAAHGRLEEYSRELEQKVAERTRELREKNDALEAANRQIQEQTQRKSAFLASMSHELRTPMNAIKGFTSLVLRREPNLTERGRQNLEKVGQASDHLLAMINDLLDLSKIEAGRMDVNPERFDVRTLIASCCETVSPLVEQKQSVHLSYEVDDAVREAHTDQARVRQMVINLLSNAIKFTEKGEVKVQVTRPPTAVRRPPSPIPGPPSSVVGRPSENDFLEIAVSDTGKGISPEHLSAIFDEYRQVRGQSESGVQRGTGLGLSITKRFAELLGGSICVESEVGKGSTFTVRIPAAFQA